MNEAPKTLPSDTKVLQQIIKNQQAVILLYLANAGAQVDLMEYMNFQQFILEPEEAILALVKDEKISDHIIRVYNLHKEVETVKKCLEHPNICMNQCVPDMSNLEQELSQDKFIITNVNYYALLEEDKYNGHFVIVEDMIDNKLVLQNPGPPPIENQEVTTDVFLKAWHSPNKDLANIIAVSQVV